MFELTVSDLYNLQSWSLLICGPFRGVIIPIVFIWISCRILCNCFWVRLCETSCATSGSVHQLWRIYHKIHIEKSSICQNPVRFFCGRKARSSRRNWSCSIRHRTGKKAHRSTRRRSRRAKRRMLPPVCMPATQGRHKHPLEMKMTKFTGLPAKASCVQWLHVLFQSYLQIIQH